MPHLILEYSENLAPRMQSERVLARAHQAMQDSGLFKPEDIRSRAYKVQEYMLHSGPEGSFAHCLIYLMEGRTVEQKRNLAEVVSGVLKASLPQADFLSVDVRDLDAQVYQKHKRHISA